ncbi:MAG: glycosyltransferase [Clostridia bacterium]|nr:glycosyltransferase [Clostridia bacterium]
MYNEKVSIIVPVYNIENYLPRCLDSLLRQTYNNLEIILVDDGATDSSGNICDNYAKQDNRIVVVHKQNGGLSSARNAGLDVATGEYIVTVDGDDFVAEDYVEHLYTILKENNARIGCCDHYILRSKEQPVEKFVEEAKLKLIPAKEYEFGHVTAWAIMFHKSLLNDNGKLARFDVLHSRTEDMPFLAILISRLHEDEFFVESNKRLYYYIFFRTDSLVHAQNEKKLLVTYEHMYETLKENCNGRKKLFRSSVAWLAVNYCAMLNAFIDNKHCYGKDYRKAKRIVRKHLLSILFSKAPAFYKKRLLLMAISPKLYGKLKARKKDK